MLAFIPIGCEVQSWNRPSLVASSFVNRMETDQPESILVQTGGLGLSGSSCPRLYGGNFRAPDFRLLRWSLDQPTPQSFCGRGPAIGPSVPRLEGRVCDCWLRGFAVKVRSHSQIKNENLGAGMK